MRRLGNAIAARAALADAQQGQNQWGIVVGVDAARQRLKVQLQPSGVTTSWLPMLTLSAGGGWGVSSMPLPGQQVFLAPDAGNAAHLVVLGGVHSTADMPPVVANTIGTAGTPSTSTAAQAPGETLITHPSGSVVRLCADGSIYLRGPVKVDGTLYVNGDVMDRHGSLDTLRQAYDAHAHTNVQPGSSNTGGTTIPVSE